MDEKVRAELSKLRPALQRDGGDVEFISASDDGVVKVKLTGACGSCPMSQMTLKAYIEEALIRNVVEVVRVESV